MPCLNTYQAPAIFLFPNAAIARYLYLHRNIQAYVYTTVIVPGDCSDCARPTPTPTLPQTKTWYAVIVPSSYLSR